MLESRKDGSFLDIYGTVRARREGERTARVRLVTHAGQRNIMGKVHGGFLLAVVDQVMFLGPALCGLRAFGGVTVEASTQFLAQVEIGPPIEVATEVLRETGRMIFLRGLIEQGGEPKLAFSGILRKPS